MNSEAKQKQFQLVGIRVTEVNFSEILIKGKEF